MHMHMHMHMHRWMPRVPASGICMHAGTTTTATMCTPPHVPAYARASWRVARSCSCEEGSRWRCCRSPRSMVKVLSLAVPQLGSCASSGRAWRLRAARHSQAEAGPLGAQPLPPVLGLAASKAADFVASDHPGLLPPLVHPLRGHAFHPAQVHCARAAAAPAALAGPGRRTGGAQGVAAGTSRMCPRAPHTSRTPPSRSIASRDSPSP